MKSFTRFWHKLKLSVPETRKSLGPAHAVMIIRSEGLGQFSLRPRGPNLAQNSVIDGGERFSVHQNGHPVGSPKP
jgi:hypothetical protein